MDKFIYLKGSVSSTENDLYMRLARARTAINGLLIVWKSHIRLNKTQFLTSSGCVNSTIWMHPMDADEAYKQKAKRELHKNVTSYIEQILEATLTKKKQLYDHQPTIPKTIQIRRSKHAGLDWRSNDELISHIFLWTPSHGRASVGRPTKTYLQQLCTYTGCSLEDLLDAMDDKDEWWERFNKICASSATWWWWWWVYFKHIPINGI